MTAGAGGIGAVLTRAFCEAGCHVHVCDIDRAALDRLAALLPGTTGSMADASIESDVDQVIADARGALGGLDVLVNSAGIAGPTGAIESIAADMWERTVAVNLNSQFLFARRAVPLLRQSRAHPCVIAMAPAAGHAGSAYRTPFASTQWAVVGLMKSLAVELQPQGVRVNAILPGALAGSRAHVILPAPATAPGTGAESSREDAFHTTAAHRLAVAQEVAAIALFLCSPAARNVTGQALSVDAAMQCP